MAQCKWCGRSGMFLRVSNDGLCPNCQPIVVMEVNRRLEILNQSLYLVENGKTLDTRLSRCDLVIEEAQALVKYEERGIRTVGPTPPTAIVANYREMRDEIIINGLKDEIRKTLEKASVATSVKTKINQLSKLLHTIRDYKAKATVKASLDEMEREVIGIISRIQLEAYLEQARKAEFKNNRKKALDQYYEALYFLKHDDIDDALQTDYITLLEGKIAELKGESPADVVEIRPSHKQLGDSSGSQNDR